MYLKKQGNQDETLWNFMLKQYPVTGSAVSHSASTWPWPWFPTGTQTGFYPSFLPLRLSSGALVVHI